MKKLLFLLIMIILPISAFAQSSGSGVEAAFATFAALIAAILVVVEFLKRTLNLTGRPLQIVSWITGIAMTLGGWMLGLGFLAAVEFWYIAILYGLGASLAANGVADTKIIQGIIELFKPKK
jgi:hypothetical protein